MTASPVPAQTLLVATTNAGKLREIAGILDGLPITLLTLRDRPGIPEPEETGHDVCGERAAQGPVLLRGDRAAERRRRFRAGDRGARQRPGRALGAVARIRLRGQVPQDPGAAARARASAGSPARFVCHVALARDGKIVFESEGIVDGETTRRTARDERLRVRPDLLLSAARADAGGAGPRPKRPPSATAGRHSRRSGSICSRGPMRPGFSRTLPTLSGPHPSNAA